MKYSKINKIAQISVLSCVGFISTQVQAMPISTDIITVLDDSGSMSGERTWVSEAIFSLEERFELVAGTDPVDVNFGLIGFTSGGSNPINVGDDLLGNATEYQAAAAQLNITGGYEDGYEAMEYVFNNYPRISSNPQNIMLISDEDRDDNYSEIDYDGMLALFANSGAVLNAIVDCSFADDSGSSDVIGINSTGTSYAYDRVNGGYMTGTGGYQSGSCYGTTNQDYVELALATGGSAWDLGFLRSSGVYADAFDLAVLDSMYSTVISQQPTSSDTGNTSGGSEPSTPTSPSTPSTDVAEPATLSMLLLSVFGLAFTRRRKA